MNNLKKYLLFAFLIENICAQTREFSFISSYSFYIFLFLGLMLFTEYFNKTTVSKYYWIYALSILYISYEFIIAPEYINTKTFNYLIARLSSYMIIAIGVNSNYEFYEKKMPYYTAIVMSIVVVWNILTKGVADGADVRLTAGYVNANDTGGYGAMAFGAMLQHTKEKGKWDKISVFVALVGLYAVLAAGSRAGMLMLILFVVYRYGFSVRTVFSIIALFMFARFILPFIGFHTIGLERFYETIEGKVGSNRDTEREAAMMMIEQKPWIGWGFESGVQGKALEISEMGSHNTYLDMSRNMGIPVTIIWVLIVLTAIFKYIFNIRKYKLPMDFNFASVLILLIVSNYEALFIGIHKYLSNVFFVSLCIMSLRLYNAKNNIPSTYYSNK